MSSSMCQTRVFQTPRKDAMMKTNKPMTMIAAILLVVAIVVGYLAYSNTPKSSWGGEMEQVIIKADNPDDPKYKPDPKLGLSGGGQR